MFYFGHDEHVLCHSRWHAEWTMYVMRLHPIMKWAGTFFIGVVKANLLEPHVVLHDSGLILFLSLWTKQTSSDKLFRKKKLPRPVDRQRLLLLLPFWFVLAWWLSTYEYHMVSNKDRETSTKFIHSCLRNVKKIYHSSKRLSSLWRM